MNGHRSFFFMVLCTAPFPPPPPPQEGEKGALSESSEVFEDSTVRTSGLVNLVFSSASIRFLVTLCS